MKILKKFVETRKYKISTLKEYDSNGKLLHSKNPSGIEFWREYDENGNLRFWLNPKEQSIYSMGWYSLEDLIAWANETGPVIKRKDEK